MNPNFSARYSALLFIEPPYKLLMYGISRIAERSLKEKPTGSNSSGNMTAFEHNAMLLVLICVLYHKTKNPFEAKISMKISFQLL